MRVEEFEKFKDGMIGVMSFYGRDLSEFAMDVWWSALSRYDMTAVMQAFNRWLMNPDHGQFPPKPADVLKMLGGGTQDQALVAWSKVDRAARSVGTYSSVVFDDPLIHRVISEMGGWVGIGQKSEDDGPFVAKEFENRYRGYAMRSEAPEYPPVLIGIAEAYNGSKGFKSDPPRLIGNAERARSVMLGGSNAPLVALHPASSALRLVGSDDSEAA